MEVRFQWNEDKGEASLNKTDRKKLLNAHWVYAADYLVDIIHEAQSLYDEVLLRRRGASK